MKRSLKQLTGVALVSALSLGTTGVLAQQAEGEARIGQTQAGAQVQTGQQYDRQQQAGQQQQQLGQQQQGVQQQADRQATEQELKRQVTDINRASQFIGMQVRNLQDERLGTIEELVFDPHQGRIAYVVLGVGGFLGIGERYIAVPLDALAPAPGENHLVLNADRQRIENAPGFERNQWPPIDAQMWGARAGFADSPEQLRDREWTTFGARGTAVTGQRDAQQQEQLRSFSGRVSSINRDDRSITLTGPQGNDYLFRLDDRAEEAKLNQLQIGSQVQVHYTVDGDRLVAHRLMPHGQDGAAGQPGGAQVGQDRQFEQQPQAQPQQD